MIKGLFPVEETYPDYQPHMTLAYVTPREAKKHLGKCDLTGKAVKFTRAIVSMHGKTISVPLHDELADDFEKSISKSYAAASYVDPQAEVLERLMGMVGELAKQVESLKAAETF
jgi:hypothetical protein